MEVCLLSRIDGDTSISRFLLFLQIVLCWSCGRTNARNLVNDSSQQNDSRTGCPRRGNYSSIRLRELALGPSNQFFAKCQNLGIFSGLFVTSVLDQFRHFCSYKLHRIRNLGTQKYNFLKVFWVFSLSDGRWWHISVSCLTSPLLLNIEKLTLTPDFGFTHLFSLFLLFFGKALLSLFYLCSSNIYALINYVGFATWVMYI